MALAALTAGAIHRRMKAAGNARDAAFALRFFKTGPGQYGAGDRFHGMRLPVIRRLERECRDLPLATIRALLRSPWHEERLLALLVLVRQYRRGDAARRAAIYRLYLASTRRINNWDLVDCSAGHIVGAHLLEKDRGVLVRMAKSPLLWDRRIAIIATGHFIGRGELAPTLRIARLLLKDEQDLIHKATGWMLREVGKKDRAVLEAFLRRHAPRMPRTMLRYAIERFPEKLRRRYLTG